MTSNQEASQIAVNLVRIIGHEIQFNPEHSEYLKSIMIRAIEGAQSQ